MIAKFGAVVALGLFLGGCAAYDAGKVVALDRGATVADEALSTALLVKCRVSTVGAIERRYMGNEQAWKLWTSEWLGDGAIALRGPE